MKSSLYTLAFALCLGVLCAAVLTGVGRFTGPYRRANARAEEVRNILGVLGVPFDEDASSEDVVALFNRKVRMEQRGGLRLFVYGEAGRVQSVAVPFAGPGLWGPIKGFLALDPKLETIRGVTFHEQEETPGLGGEIASDWFRGQFRGKALRGADGTPGIRIVRGGGASGPNAVDGITGATMTCEKVETMLNATIRRLLQKGGGDVH